MNSFSEEFSTFKTSNGYIKNLRLYPFAADLNNDGDDDLVLFDRTYSKKRMSGQLAEYQEPILLMSLSDGGYSIHSGFSELGINCQVEQVVFADFDDNNFSDMFVTCYSDQWEDQRSYLVQNVDGKEFVDVTDNSGLAMTNIDYSLRVECALPIDVNDDGLLDIYAASHLFVNLGKFKFENQAVNYGISKLFDEGCVFEDVNLDGQVDLVRHAPIHGPKFHFRSSSGTFVEREIDVHSENNSPNKELIYPYSGMNSVPINCSPYLNLIFGRDSGDSGRGRRVTESPVITQEGYSLSFVYSVFDGLKTRELSTVIAPNWGDINSDFNVDLARLIKRSDGYYSEILVSNKRCENGVKIQFASNDGYRNKHGVKYTVRDKNYDYVREYILNPNRGYLNGNSYESLVHLPNNNEEFYLEFNRADGELLNFRISRGMTYKFNGPQLISSK